MLRLIFWILVIANAALFAFHQGVFDSPAQAKHEPERAQRQLNADKIRLLPTGTASTSNVSPLAKEDAKLVECVEIGIFPLSQIKSIEERLAPLGLGQNQMRVNVEEVTSHMVYIPPLDGKEAVDRKIAELQGMGIKNYYVLSDNSAYPWGISLGIFKSAQAANNQLADLNGKGVMDARIAPRGIATDNVLYRLRNLNASSMQALDKIMSDFPDQKKSDCGQ